MSTNTVDAPRRVTTSTFRAMKARGEKIAMLTSYDYTMAQLVDGAGIDGILVGDSAANVVCGYGTTLPITLDEMIFLSRGVARACQRALVVTDMPFGSYQVSADEALRSCVRVMKEAGVAAVKMEGGADIAPAIRRITAAGIPVMGHLGLTPQSVNQLGGYGVQGREEAQAEKLINDAQLLEESGCFAVVLEKVPAVLARKVSEKLSIPTIGIGAGAGTDGQILVVTDMLGMNPGFKPKFLRHYAQLGDVITEAVGAYCADVRSASFPSEAEQY